MQEPVFCKRHTLVNSVPGVKTVPSGTVTSLTKRAWLQRTGMGVIVGGGEVGKTCVAVALGGMAVGTAECRRG